MWSGLEEFFLVVVSFFILLDFYLYDLEFFVVGENYTKSVDSRIYGPITKNQIIGKVLQR